MLTGGPASERPGHRTCRRRCVFRPTVIEGLVTPHEPQPRKFLARLSRFIPSKLKTRRLKWPTTRPTVWRVRCGPQTANVDTPLLKRMDTGIVWVNTWLNRDLRTPFGGDQTIGRWHGKVGRGRSTSFPN